MKLLSVLLRAAPLAAALLAWPALAQDAAIVQRATELRDAPGANGASLGALAEGSAVERTGERKGSWIKVRTPNATGWVHMFDVGSRASAAPANNSGATGGLRSLGNMLGGGSGTTTATSTVGIRGLDAEDIANAQPNLGAVAEAERQRVNANDARRFGNNAALRTQQVAALPEPARPTGAGSAGRSDNFSPN